jgi:SAM-dependent methyltransferase
MVSSQEVEMAYRLILGREPESARAVEFHCSQWESLQALRAAFLASVEFRAQKLPAVQPDIDYNPPLAVETALTPAKHQQMLKRVERCWSALGKTEPYWSVASFDRYKSGAFDAHASQFYASGERDVQRMLAWLRRNRINPAALDSCCEYGCGVGRVTTWLCSQFARVFACDVSEPHLKLARRHLLAQGHSNVTFRKIDSLSSLAQFDPVDLVFSIIVLQHNPPPVIADIVGMLLRSLNPGGLAFFQVPTYAAGYRFNAKEYLRRPAREASFEMHLLPQSSIFRIARDEGCAILEVQPDTYVGARQWISNTFLIQRCTSGRS